MWFECSPNFFEQCRWLLLSVIIVSICDSQALPSVEAYYCSAQRKEEWWVRKNEKWMKSVICLDKSPPQPVTVHLYLLASCKIHFLLSIPVLFSPSSMLPLPLISVSRTDSGGYKATEPQWRVRLRVTMCHPEKNKLYPYSFPGDT